MYKVSTMSGSIAKNHARTPTRLWGMGLTPEQVARVSKVEVWGTSFKDHGPDFTVHRAIDSKGEIVASYQVMGY